MIKTIIIPNSKKLEELKANILKDGSEKIHVLSDFDRTLTYSSAGGEKVPSVISILRSSAEYLGKNYVEKAHALYKKYHPIEIDPKIPAEEKKRKMEEWWQKHFDLLISLGFKKSHFEKIMASRKIIFRHGALEFFDLLHKYKIPLIIMSAGGLGSEIISMLFKREARLYPNIHIISNSFIWDKDGKAIGIKEPIIHIFNKDETMVKDYPVAFKAVKNRKNVLLLGDSLGDTGMIKGFDYDNLIKIGFLNEEVEKNLKEYKKIYDIVILNDSDMEFVLDLFKNLTK